MSPHPVEGRGVAREEVSEPVLSSKRAPGFGGKLELSCALTRQTASLPISSVPHIGHASHQLGTPADAAQSCHTSLGSNVPLAPGCPCAWRNAFLVRRSALCECGDLPWYVPEKTRAGPYLEPRKLMLWMDKNQAAPVGRIFIPACIGFHPEQNLRIHRTSRFPFACDSQRKH